jgi:hypothetical protein
MFLNMAASTLRCPSDVSTIIGVYCTILGLVALDDGRLSIYSGRESKFFSAWFGSQIDANSDCCEHITIHVGGGTALVL